MQKISFTNAAQSDKFSGIVISYIYSFSYAIFHRMPLHLV
jgi:hypothetical protein